jgi:putative sterol carrier protein
MKTIEEAVAKMESRITDELAKKINSVCLIEIGSEKDVQYWTVDFTASSNRIFKTEDNSDVACRIVVSNLDDWFAIINGDINPTTAFMKGKIKIKGDITTALKMQEILSS